MYPVTSQFIIVVIMQFVTTVDSDEESEMSEVRNNNNNRCTLIHCTVLLTYNTTCFNTLLWYKVEFTRYKFSLLCTVKPSLSQTGHIC